MAKEKFERYLIKWEKIYSELLEDIRVAVSKREVNAFFVVLQDKQDYITALTTSNSHLDELSKELRYSIPPLERLIKKYIETDNLRKTVFEIGRLYGTMQLSSRICYEKKKDNQVYSTALSICGIKHFEEIVSLLYKQKELTQTELCEDLQMKPSALSECIKKILDTNMIVSRRSGKFKVYSLSDDGLRFARLRLQELDHEKKISSVIESQYYNTIPSGVGDNEEQVREKTTSPYKSRFRWNGFDDCENVQKDDKFEDEDFHNMIIVRKEPAYVR